MRVAAAVLALCLGPALALGQSLGDEARRQANLRVGRPPATKTYTDVDVRPEEPEAAPPDVRETHPPVSTKAGHGSVVKRPTSRGESHAEDSVRAQLDREAEQRKRQEILWRQRALQARVRIDDAKRARDAACGPGVLVFTGG